MFLTVPTGKGKIGRNEHKWRIHQLTVDWTVMNEHKWRITVSVCKFLTILTGTGKNGQNCEKHAEYVQK